VEFTTSPLLVPKILHRRYEGMLTYLMNILDGYQKKIPGDRWIMGQRVYHVLDHGEIERAQAIARDCRSDKWWCASLVGFTSYHLYQFQRADSAFAVAMDAVPAADRCTWESVEDLLHGDPDRKWYTDLSCEERKEVTPTIWWLSDPLYLTPGNERLAAHYYREVSRQLFLQTADAQPPIAPAPRRSRMLDLGTEAYAQPSNDRLHWQSGALSALLRSLGVPSFRIGGRNDINAEVEILLQYKQPTYHFFPSVAAMREPLRATAESWNLEDPNAMERYHPAFGAFTTLSHQIAWFKRDEHSRLVAAVDVAGNTLLGGPTQQRLFTTALFLTRAPGDFRMYRDTIPGTRTTYHSRVPAESTIVSVEFMVSGIGAGRVRLASGPPSMPAQRLQLSDLLLLDHADSLPGNLDAAAPRARPNMTFDRAEPVGLFWEVYGLTRGDSVSYTVSAVEGRRSAITNVARFIGIVGAERSTSVQWKEYVSSDAASPARNIAIDISALTRGGYTLRLEVVVPGQELVQISREIDVVAFR
jgi:hypothetical protein